MARLSGESVDRRAVSGSLCPCVFCVWDVGFGDRKASPTWCLTGMSRSLWLMWTWCQVLTGEHRDRVAVLLQFGRNGGVYREPDTFYGPGTSQGLQSELRDGAKSRRGDSDGSLHSGMIMTKMMMLENDPLTDAWDVRLWYCLAMMADIGMISVRVQHRSNRKTNSSKGNLTKTDNQRYIFLNAVS